jgi:hypothetical protein
VGEVGLLQWVVRTFYRCVVVVDVTCTCAATDCCEEKGLAKNLGLEGTLGIRGVVSHGVKKCMARPPVCDA